jgi:hypothetical protein
MSDKKKKRRKVLQTPQRPRGLIRVTPKFMFDLQASEILRRLIVAVQQLRQHRQMNAHESPESQDA